MRTLGKFAVLAAVVSALSCQNPLLRPDPQTVIQLEIELDSMPNVYAPGARVLAYQTAYVEVTVFNGSTTPFFTKKFGVIEENGRFFARGSLPGLPAGEGYTLDVTAFDGSGAAWTSGSTGFAVQAGGTTRIQLNLSPVAGMIQPYTGIIGGLHPITINGRRTHFYNLTISTALPVYYTVDVFPSNSTGQAPQLEVSVSGARLRNYAGYHPGQSTAGGMVSNLQELTIAIGNRDSFQRTFQVLVRQDGHSPPDGKGLTIHLDEQSTDYQVNDWTPVRLEFFPEPFYLEYSQTDPGAHFFRTFTSSGTVSIPAEELARFGKNSWAVRLTHDTDASQRMHQFFYSPNGDIRTWHDESRPVNTLMPNFSDVTNTNLGTMSYPGVIYFDNGANPLMRLGQPTYAVSWTHDSGVQPNIGTTGAEPNNAIQTNADSMGAYLAGPEHYGYISANQTIHTPTDVDWLLASNLPYTAPYRFWTYTPDTSAPPLRFELYRNSESTAFSVVETGPGNGYFFASFPGTASDNIFVKVSSHRGAIGTYRFGVVLDAEVEDEREHLTYPWNPLPLTASKNGYVYAVWHDNGDHFTFTNPYGNNMRFIARSDWPSPTYLRQSPDFPIQLQWSPAGTAGPPTNNHPSSWVLFWPSLTANLDLLTPVNPGRRVLLTLTHWWDENDAGVGNNLEANASLLPLVADSKAYSFHDAADIDWYRFSSSIGRTYTLRTSLPTHPAVAGDAARSRIRVTNDTVSIPIVPLSLGDYLYPSSDGTTEITWNESIGGMRKVEVQPSDANQTGGYLLYIEQRPQDATMRAHWRFNNSLSSALSPEPFVLDATGVSFIQGSEGQNNGAVRFSTADARLTASGASAFFPIPSAGDELAFVFWVYIPSGLTDGSLGWVFSQEDNAGNLNFGLHAQKTGTSITLQVMSGGVTANISGSLSENTWYPLGVSIGNLSSGSTITVMRFDTIETPSFTGSSAHTATADQVFRIGSRFNNGTSFKGYIDDFRIYRGIIWGGADYHWLKNQPR